MEVKETGFDQNVLTVRLVSPETRQPLQLVFPELNFPLNRKAEEGPGVSIEVYQPVLEEIMGVKNAGLVAGGVQKGSEVEVYFRPHGLLERTVGKEARGTHTGNRIVINVPQIIEEIAPVFGGFGPSLTGPVSYETARVFFHELQHELQELDPQWAEILKERSEMIMKVVGEGLLGIAAGTGGAALTRRQFLKLAGVAAGGLAAVSVPLRLGKYYGEDPLEVNAREVGEKDYYRWVREGARVPFIVSVSESRRDQV